MSGLNLLPGEGGLFRVQEARMGLAFDRTGEAEVGAMTSARVFAPGGPRFAAFDGAFGQRAAAHGFGFSQFGGELADASGRRCIVHGLSYGYTCRKNNKKNSYSHEIPFWWRAP